MGLHFDVWAASIYSKWKTRQDNWKPMTASIDASKSPIAIFVAALEARDPVPSYLDEPSELSAGSIADVTDITDEFVDRGSGAQVAMAGGRALGRRGRGRARGQDGSRCSGRLLALRSSDKARAVRAGEMKAQTRHGARAT